MSVPKCCDNCKYSRAPMGKMYIECRRIFGGWRAVFVDDTCEHWSPDKTYREEKE